ncbi:MAG: hypothetical protein WD598_17025 [Acidimicrobiia bacterium]
MRLVEGFVAGMAYCGPLGADARCYWCWNDAAGAPVLDTDAYVEWEGEVAVCAACVTDAAALLGLCQPARKRSNGFALLDQLPADCWSCFMCRCGDTGSPFIDVGVQPYGEPRILVCSGCIVEAHGLYEHAAVSM